MGISVPGGNLASRNQILFNLWNLWLKKGGGAGR